VLKATRVVHGILDDGREIRLGFMIEFTPYLSAGTDSELQIATILTAINVPDTIMQFGILVME
jgi:hypothetical protein